MSTPLETLQEGLRLHQAGQLPEAWDRYRAVLKMVPDDPNALHLSGVLAAQMGQVEAAVALLRRAVTVAPGFVEAMVNLGNVLQTIEAWQEAEHIYGKVLQLNPQMPEALNNLGNALAAQGKTDAAERAYRQAIAQAPDFPEPYNNLGNLLLDGQPQEAEACYRKALLLKPEYGEAAGNLGRVLQDGGDLQGALGCFEKALSLMPGRPEPLYNIATAYHDAGLFEQARQAYTQALDLRPEYAEALYSLGQLELQSGDANLAETHFSTLLGLRPDSADAKAGLGRAQARLGRFQEAEATLQEILATHPDHPEALGGLAALATAANQWQAAHDLYRRAVAVAPDNPRLMLGLGDVLGELGELRHSDAMFNRILERHPVFIPALRALGGLRLNKLGDAEGAYDALSRAAAQVSANANLLSATLMTMQYCSSVGPQDIAEAHAAFGHLFADLPRPAKRQRPSGAPLRVGLVSADFRLHATGFFLRPLLQHHDKSRLDLVLVSNTKNQDEVTADLKGLADGFCDIAGLDDEAAASAIVGLDLDLLIDLNGHTNGNRLAVFAKRPVAVQATWLDYVGTTGLTQIDWLISDARHLPPEMEPLMVERVARLPENLFCYAPPALDVAVADAPFQANGHVTFGCFNALFKLSAVAFDRFAEILLAVPGSRLVLSAPSLDFEDTRVRVRREMMARGIEAERMDLLGRTSQPEMLARHGLIDIALDSFPYVGGLTTLEALWMGVPVLTVPGDRVAGRHGAAHLWTIGLDELVAEDKDAYVRKAVELAGDPARLTAYRQSLRQRLADSPLCDGAAFAAAFTDLAERLVAEV